MDTAINQYGTHSKTTLLDDEGGRVTVKTNYVAGRPTTPVRNYFELPKRVHNQKEEHAEYLAFSDELKNDPTMLDPSWRIEHNARGKSEGYYYVWRCFTRLEY